MNIFLKMFKGPIKKIILKELAKEELQEIVVKSINEKLDIPKLTEVEEAVLFNKIYDAAEEAIALAIDRI